MPIYHKLEQRSYEWYMLRLGVPTASEFHKLVTPTGRLSKQAEGYAYELMAELMLGRTLDSPETQWMTRGQELEDDAIKAYEFTVGETTPGGFITNDEGTYGCSPDRLVGTDGGLEIKCPAPHTHVGYLIDPDGMIQEKYPQVQGQMLVTERKWWDLMSYHPEMPPVIIRVKRNEEYIDTLRTVLDAFVKQLVATRKHLEDKHGKFPEIVAKPAVEREEFDVTDSDLDAMIEAGIINP